MDKKLSRLLIEIVKDLEDTREIIHGYSYVRTIRNILIEKDAAIAPNFKDKYYYGLIGNLTLEETEFMLDSMIKSNRLSCIHTNHGKLYCTKDYYKHTQSKYRNVN